MGAFVRRNEILTALRERPRMSTQALSDRFGVSTVTIRGDLDALEQSGWLRRVHGGAELVRPLEPEQGFLERRHQHEPEKRRLAQRALELIRPGDSLLLDNSTSAYQLAVALSDRKGLRVLTNSLPIVAVLAPCREIETVVLGGQLRSETLSMVGPSLSAALEGLHADWFFLSASGLSAERGVTDADLREVEAKRTMLAHAGHVVALIDSSKFDREAFRTVAPLAALHHLITDGHPPPRLKQALAATGVQVTVV